MVGTLLGVLITTFNQRGLLNKQIKRDEEKEKRGEARETLEIYNKVLMIDGGSMLINHYGDSFDEFDLELYSNKVRPILYEKYHIIHDDVAKITRNIDKRIQQCLDYEETSDEDHEYLCKEYTNLIEKVNTHIINFRTTNYKS